MTSALILAALAEDGANGLEGALQDKAEDQQHDKADQRHLHAELDEIAEGEERREDAAEEVDDASADEVADAFDVGHDAGDQGAGAVLIVEGDRQAADVRLDLHAQFGDEALAFFREQLSECVGGDALNDRGENDRSNDHRQQVQGALPYITLSIKGLVDHGRTRPLKRLTIINRKLAPSRQAARLNQLPYLGQDFLEFGLGAVRLHVGKGGA